MQKSKAKLPLFGLNMAAFALFLILFPCACLARTTIENQDCGSAFCGNVNISYPFRLKTQPRNCGYHSLELECENNNRTTFVMKNGKFSVKEINYENSTMRLVDARLDKDDCSSLPLSSIDLDLRRDLYYHLPTTVYLVNCPTAMKSSPYVDASRCANSSSRPSSYFYFLDSKTPASDFNQSCTVEAEVPIEVNNNTIAGMSTVDIYKKLSMGFELPWHLVYSDYYEVSFQHKHDCGSAFCGNVNISYPFRLKTQPRNCGRHWLELECENNNRTTLVMKHGKFSVKEINYENYTMRVVDARIDNDDCSSLPLSSFLYMDFVCFPYLSYTYPYPYSYPYPYPYRYPYRYPYVYLVNCTTTMKSSLYVDASRCANSSSRPSFYFYFLDSRTPPSDFNQSCTVEAEVPIMVYNNTIAGMSTVDIYKKLSMGFEPSWENYDGCYPKSKISFQERLYLVRDRLAFYLDRYIVYFIFLGPNLSYHTEGEYISKLYRVYYFICIVFIRFLPFRSLYALKYILLSFFFFYNSLYLLSWRSWSNR
ncbi:hypothetical protein REPUB_Repub11eG0016000 [Reevesia pubescens]